MAETDPFESMSPADIAEMTQRLEFTDEPVEPVETGPGTGPINVSTTVKMTRDQKKGGRAARQKSRHVAVGLYPRADRS
jgi:hypothetical protein